MVGGAYKSQQRSNPQRRETGEQVKQQFLFFSSSSHFPSKFDNAFSKYCFQKIVFNVTGCSIKRTHSKCIHQENGRLFFFVKYIYSGKSQGYRYFKKLMNKVNKVNQPSPSFSDLISAVKINTLTQCLLATKACAYLVTSKTSKRVKKTKKHKMSQYKPGE